MDLATALLEQHGRVQSPAGDVRLLLPYLARALIEFHEVALHLLAGNWPELGTGDALPFVTKGTSPEIGQTRHCSVQPNGDVEEREPDLTLRELAKRYIEDSKPARKTTDELFRVVQQFGEVNGADRQVRGVGKPSVSRFAAILSKKPRNLRAEDRDLPLDTLVEQYASKDVERIGLGTVEKCMRLLGAVFEFGRRHGYVTENPFIGMIPAAAGHEKTKRRDFTAAELEGVFTSPVYSG